jgi:hypothetical protein
MLPRQLRQFLPGLGVGFSADWVSRKQGGDRNLGSIATQAPWLSRHATGPSLLYCRYCDLSYCGVFLWRLHLPWLSSSISALCLRT